MKTIFLAVLIIFILSANVLRFTKLDSAPHGYHVDEYAAAVNLQCMAKEGTNAWGSKYYLFLHQGFGTPKPPNYTYPALLWTKIFGYKIEAVRAFSALAIVVGVIGLFFLGKVLGGWPLGLWSAAAATISPWSWVLGRLGFESFFAPVSLIWGLWFFLRGRHPLDYMWSGICFCCAAYYYPPARIYVALFLMGIWLHETFISKKKHAWWLLAIALVIPAIPLIQAQLKGDLDGRISEVAIWNPEYLASIHKTKGLIDLSQVFVINYVKYFNPQFLFLTGDPDYKHSTQQSGLLSWLDILAWSILGLGALLWRFKPFDEFNPLKKYGRLLLLCLACYLLAIVPAAMTFEGAPNSLRMCLGWPFLCLITGLTMSTVCQRQVWMACLAVVLVITNSAVFLNDYFNHYPDRAKFMFAFWIPDEAKTLRTQEDWIGFMVKYHIKDYHVRYFQMQKLGQGCAESYEVWKKIGALLDKLPPN